MKIAIMQPYLFPYLGYFQLIHAADLFGIGDDVQYIEGGWINRNRILINKKATVFTFPIKKDSFGKPIKERYYHEGMNQKKSKLFRTLTINYSKAPYLDKVLDLLKSILTYDEMNISKFNENQLHVICKYLEIETVFVNSIKWEAEVSKETTVEARAVKKLKQLSGLGVNHFINPVGGKDLYSKEYFKKNGLKLSYLKPKEISYKQFDDAFVPNLSIIDVMMFNSVDAIKSMLRGFELF